MSRYLAPNQATASSELLEENELSRTPLSGFTVHEIEATCGIEAQIIDSVTIASGDIPLETSKVRSCQRSLDDACKLLETLEKRLVATAENVRESAARRDDRVGVPVEYLDQLCLRDLARDLRERAARVAELTETLSHAVPRIPDDTPKDEDSASNAPGACAFENTDATEHSPATPNDVSIGKTGGPLMPKTNSPISPPPPPPHSHPPPPPQSKEQLSMSATTVLQNAPRTLPPSPLLPPPPPPTLHNEIKSKTSATTSVSQLSPPSQLTAPIDIIPKPQNASQAMGQTRDMRPTGGESAPRARYPSKFRRSRIP